MRLYTILLPMTPRDHRLCEIWLLDYWIRFYGNDGKVADG